MNTKEAIKFIYDKNYPCGCCYHYMINEDSEHVCFARHEMVDRLVRSRSSTLDLLVKLNGELGECKYHDGSNLYDYDYIYVDIEFYGLLKTGVFI